MFDPYGVVDTFDCLSVTTVRPAMGSWIHIIAFGYNGMTPMGEIRVRVSLRALNNCRSRSIGTGTRSIGTGSESGPLIIGKSRESEVTREYQMFGVLK